MATYLLFKQANACIYHQQKITSITTIKNRLHFLLHTSSLELQLYRIIYVMTHRWRQQTGAVATAQVVRLDAASLAWASVSKGTWETILPLKSMRFQKALKNDNQYREAECFWDHF